MFNTISCLIDCIEPAQLYSKQNGRLTNKKKKKVWTSVDMIQSLGFRVGSRSDTCWGYHMEKKRKKKKQPKHFLKWKAKASYGCSIFQNAIQVFILYNMLSKIPKHIGNSMIKNLKIHLNYF